LETRKDILWRSYLVYIVMLIFGVAIFAKAFFIQNVEGKYWKIVSDSIQLTYKDLGAVRGTIYSEDGKMLSSSIPFFDIYLDFGAQGIQEKNGKRFKEYVDSIAIDLSNILQQKTTAGYKRELLAVFYNKERYHLLQKNIDFNQYKALKNTTFIKLNKNKSGFRFEEKEKRLAPFGMLARRTIGLSREYIGEDGKLVNINVGLEKTYDSLLKGVSGKRLVRRISGGATVPVEEGLEVESQNGKDIISTLDVNIQNVAEQALLKVMEANECLNGTCIVMEVKTGKIKAIANLGRNLTTGEYAEDFNYAVNRSEPGSTFKLMTMLALLEDQYTTLNQHINIEGGRWDYKGRTVKDAEGHVRSDVTVQEAFELSSNVGMAKLAITYYSNNPKKYLKHLERLHLTVRSGIDLKGESFPLIPNPDRKDWSATSLPWMSFGYNVAVSPLQTLMVYNAVANNGKMMRPYLVNSIVQEGRVIKSFSPVTVEESICSATTLKQLKICLEGVIKRGTGKRMSNEFYTLAGKTGTAMVANGNKGYTEDTYNSSFAGYFPAENPKYSCIVMIKNKPHAIRYHGVEIASPVFQDIANKLFTVDSDLYSSFRQRKQVDSSKIESNGSSKDFKKIAASLNSRLNQDKSKGDWSKMRIDKKEFVGSTWNVKYEVMPDLTGFGLKDALEIMEKQQLQVIATGKGKVISQSIQSGTSIQKGQTIYLTLGTATN
jgi:cell division protein FtsI (penicillin-binding protein 3)